MRDNSVTKKGHLVKQENVCSTKFLNKCRVARPFESWLMRCRCRPSQKAASDKKCRTNLLRSLFHLIAYNPSLKMFMMRCTTPT